MIDLFKEQKEYLDGIDLEPVIRECDKAKIQTYLSEIHNILDNYPTYKPFDNEDEISSSLLHHRAHRTKMWKARRKLKDLEQAVDNLLEAQKVYVVIGENGAIGRIYGNSKYKNLDITIIDCGNSDCDVLPEIDSAYNLQSDINDGEVIELSQKINLNKQNKAKCGRKRKFTSTQAETVINDYSTGDYSIRELAEKYKCSTGAIMNVVHRQNGY